MSYFTDKLRTIDPKIVAVAIGYLLTLAVVKLGLDINAVLIPGYLTVNGAIALAGGLAAGYWKSNIGTILRTPQEDGNPDPSRLQTGQGLVELVIVLFVLVLIVLLVAPRL
jgi:hypothetical protein